MNSWRNALPLAGEPTADFRERLARQQAEAAERRQHALTEQASPLNSAQARINIWEQLHAIDLPRDAAHRLVALIAANTGLSIAQVRAEQQRRAAPRPAAADVSIEIPAEISADIPAAIPEVPASPG